ncbi:glucosamine--fructose-6-phosphate aminotransferase, isomerizing [Sulfobacillus acidophilus TPY]|uniref:Glutamine--fructose-6-phosphate aminotransferase [isomerizing] n=1 Tax=Sulfobacillus acidophilus (strain ATCC 700253 / DSM 10332 / NAL) TaxID=679936 RepID=G8TYG7_SULAD|nr:glucosamine--fructose-6-phosphate aminotransferase, isomerizing [Sulfobacillus acidophilus TPY]AEW06228.1 Glucosamine--fructose-6-phosphate aminotransferase (isomerizing) [Sulfobacillus acidophilus DSM 10332]
MCGIVGFVGDQDDALPFLMAGLKRLEYRGYDSAGIALAAHDGIVIQKTRGRLAQLEKRVATLPGHVPCGIGHTRWATHGRPTDENAHPHMDCTGTIATVHNGIIENFQDLKEELIAKGHRFLSDTDTEVIPHLLEEYGGLTDLVGAVQAAEARLRGAYAFLAVSSHEPDKIVAVRRSSPLVVGLGEGQNYLASDFSAFLDLTRRAIVLENGDMAVVTPQNVSITTTHGEPLNRPVMVVDWDISQAERGGYPHFMLKEIMEQPDVWSDALLGRVQNQRVVWREMGLPASVAETVRRIRIVAAGTAYHAGLVGKMLIERLARIPVEVEVASEFRYSTPIFEPGTLVMAISQSGETADTLASVRLAHELGVPTYAVVNQVGSTLARESDYVVYTHAGPEIAVASTKAYTTQLLVLTLLALGLADLKGRGRPDLVQHLLSLPHIGQTLLGQLESVRQMAESLSLKRDVFYIGRGLDYALAMEGQLKIKEIAYIHAEAYAAGELKHGTLALIEDGTPVVAIVTERDVAEKTISNILEVKARGAEAWGILDRQITGDIPVDHQIVIDTPDPLLAPAIAALPLQLLAYWTAVFRGEDVDKPRNLAKSVTVE